jgi:hypothetical protein
LRLRPLNENIAAPLAQAALIIALVSFCWSVVWSVYQFRQQNQRQLRVRKGQGWWIAPDWEHTPFITIDVTAVNTGNVPITVNAVHARIVGGHSWPIENWLHQEPTPLGSRAVLGRGEAWIGRLNMKDFTVRVKRERWGMPGPWRIVFGVTDAAGNTYELDETDAIELHPLG